MATGAHPARRPPRHILVQQRLPERHATTQRVLRPRPHRPRHHQRPTTRTHMEIPPTHATIARPPRHNLTTDQRQKSTFVSWNPGLSPPLCRAVSGRCGRPRNAGTRPADPGWRQRRPRPPHPRRRVPGVGVGADRGRGLRVRRPRGGLGLVAAFVGLVAMPLLYVAVVLLFLPSSNAYAREIRRLRFASQAPLGPPPAPRPE